MTEDTPITRREFNLVMENHTLKLSEVIEDKFDEFQKRLHDSNIERRESIVRETTGFGWDDRAEIRQAVQHAHNSYTGSADTKQTAKRAVIGFGVLSLGGLITWIVTNYEKMKAP